MSSWARILAMAGTAVAGVALLWVLFGPLPTLLGGTDLQRLEPAERIAAIGAIRGQIGTVVSAAVVAGGLFYTGKRYFLDRDKQFTDRFNAAVDHLKSDNDIARAGGVRALDRILHDSPTDRNRVVESLTQFIRRHSVPDSLPDDVAAAVAALRDRPKPSRNANHVPLDLRDAHLPDANLRGAALSEADLTHVTLTSANLTDAVMTRARLHNATLTGATLTGASLTDTDLRAATLTKADLASANLTNADLTGADLRGATLTRTDLTGATLVNTDLRDTDLRDTTGLANAQVKRARADERTLLPPGIDHPLNSPAQRRSAP